MKKDKIINGFCYIEDGDMVFVSLYTERKSYYELQLFAKFTKDYKPTERHIILVYEDGGGITPLYTTAHNKCPKDMDFEDLIKEVYDICIITVKENLKK